MFKFIILTSCSGDLMSIPAHAITNVLKLKEEEYPRVYFKKQTIASESDSDRFYVWLHVLECIEEITDKVNKALQ